MPLFPKVTPRFIAASLTAGSLASMLTGCGDCPEPVEAVIPTQSSVSVAAEPTAMAVEVQVDPEPLPESFSYDPIDPDMELIEPIPSDVEDFFEDYLEIDYVPERIALGRTLFHDTRFSTDNTLSCASCHDLRYGGIDRAISATGIRSQIGPVNTPTVFNSAFNVAQFWDGRAEDLQTQAAGPPLASGEMGSSWEEILGKLQGDANIRAMVKDAYPELEDGESFTAGHLLMSIADFEKTLITPNAPFDKYLLGDADAVSEHAKEGYQIFKDVGCIECHNGPAVGGKSFQVLGRKKPYFTEETAALHPGRFAATGHAADKNAFKVGNLRNVTLTGPYFHDGSIPTLEEAVRKMAIHQLNVELSDGQVSRILAFLDTLTGEYEGVPLGQIQNTHR